MSIIREKYSDKFYFLLYNIVNIKEILNLIQTHSQFRKGL